MHAVTDELRNTVEPRDVDDVYTPLTAEVLNVGCRFVTHSPKIPLRRFLQRPGDTDIVLLTLGIDMDDVNMHGTRKLREDSGSAVVTLPPEAVEGSGLKIGENVMVMTVEGEDSVLLLPWLEEDIRDMISSK